MIKKDILIDVLNDKKGNILSAHFSVITKLILLSRRRARLLVSL